MRLLVLQKIDLIVSLFILHLLSFLVPLLNRIDLALQLNHLIVQLILSTIQIINSLFQISFSLLSLKLFPHAKCDSRLVQSLIRGNGHLNLIPHSEQQQSSLRQVDSHLSNDLIKALREQLFSDRTNS